MPRVATCNSCGARFKIPDDSKVKRAKCSSCGEVIEIPDADDEAGSGAAEASPDSPKSAPRKASGSAPRKPSSPAPSKSSHAAPRKAPPRKSSGKAPSAAPRKAGGKAPSAAPRKSSGKAPSGRTSGARASGRRAASSGGSRRGGRKAAASSGDSGTNVGMIVGIGVVVLLLAAGGWYFLSGDDQATPATGTPGATEAVTSAESGTDPAASDDSSRSESADTSTADGTPPTDSSSSSDAGGDGRAPPAAVAADEPGDRAPAAVTSKTTSNEPLPTLIDYDLLLPVPGTSVEDLAVWAATIRELHVDFGGAAGRARTKLLKTVKGLDAITATPAYLNALIGVDLANADSVRGIGRLVADWQSRVGYVPRFSYPVDPSRMDTKTQNLRVTVINGWRDWWTGRRKAGQDEAVLEEYRLAVAAALEKLDG